MRFSSRCTRCDQIVGDIDDSRSRSLIVTTAVTDDEANGDEGEWRRGDGATPSGSGRGSGSSWRSIGFVGFGVAMVPLEQAHDRRGGAGQVDRAVARPATTGFMNRAWSRRGRPRSWSRSWLDAIADLERCRWFRCSAIDLHADHVDTPPWCFSARWSIAPTTTTDPCAPIRILSLPRRWGSVACTTHGAGLSVTSGRRRR